MKRKKKRILLTEFVVEVYTDGSIVWDGLEQFLVWKLNHKLKEGLISYVKKIVAYR